jgi:abequosyltransferase
MTPKLSICIPTLNRGSFIGQTLASIVGQWQEGVEIVIVDGGSTDNTAEVVSTFQRDYAAIRYVRRDGSIKAPSNEGFDRDCDHAVELSGGQYCWLMTDDDLLMPGAIARVLREAEKGYAVMVASVEIQNLDFSKVLIARRPALAQDKIYPSGHWGEFAADNLTHLTFVGAVIVDRQFWLGRNRQKYFGTGFVHVGALFGDVSEGSALSIATPLVSIRFGNAQWSSRAFQIWMFGWPELIWSFSGLPEAVRQSVCPREPWDSLVVLLRERTLGIYSIREYRLFLAQRPLSRARRFLLSGVAIFPRWILLAMAYPYAWTRPSDSAMLLFTLNESLQARR